MFGMDVVLPDMLHASIRHAPVFGARVGRFANEAHVRGLPGVVDVAIVDGRHVAVVAGSWWEAEQAAAQADIGWSSTEADTVGSADLSARLQTALDTETPTSTWTRATSRRHSTGAGQR